MQHLCTVCSKKFSKHSNLRQHAKKFHSDQLNKIAPNKSIKCASTCNMCLKTFSKSSNFIRHVNKFHPGEKDELIPPKYYPYQCEKCKKHFSVLNNFKSHQKIHLRESGNEQPQFLRCTLCDENILKRSLFDHYEEKHDIKLVSRNYTFSNEREFQKWKIDLEKRTHSSYVMYSRSYKNKYGIKKSTYVCHRSGFYVKQGRDVRQLKKQGSNKINGICPSKLQVKMFQNGNLEIDFIETHIGHDNTLDHLNITASERKEIASKLAAKIPFSCILDDIRDTIANNKLERMHLLTKKDLHNIKQCSNLNSEGLRHENNEVIRIEWVDEHEPETQLELNTEKEKLRLSHLQLIDKITSFEQLEAFKNITTPLEPTLLAIEKKNQENSIYISIINDNV